MYLLVCIMLGKRWPGEEIDTSMIISFHYLNKNHSPKCLLNNNGFNHLPLVTRKFIWAWMDWRCNIFVHYNLLKLNLSDKIVSVCLLPTDKLKICDILLNHHQVLSHFRCGGSNHSLQKYPCLDKRKWR